MKNTLLTIALLNTVALAEPDYTLGTPSTLDNNPTTAEFLGGNFLKQIKASEAYKQGWTGKGVTIGVLDKGIDELHPDLVPNFSHTVNTSGDDIGPDNHGTHVAGIVAAAKDNVGMHGVAYESEIVDYKVSGASGVTSFTTTALIDAYTNDIKVVNMSNGKYSWTNYNNTQYASKFIDTLTNDTSIIVSAGNKADLCADIDSSGCNAFAKMPLYTGNSALNDGTLDGAYIVVGAVTSDLQITEYSNKAGITKDWYMVAPGGYAYDGTELDTGLNQGFITSLIPGGTYNGLSGTSQAAPVVTGAFAVISQKYPNLKGREIRDILFATATDLGDPGVDAVYGHGMLNLKAAINFLEGDTADVEPVIDSLTYTGTAKEFSTISVVAEYTIADGETFDKIEYKLDGNDWSTTADFTFNSSGTKTIFVKVTDNSNNFVTETLNVEVAVVPFNELTYEQQLIKAIKPELYTSMVNSINTNTGTSSADIETGRNQVINNPSSYSLYTEAQYDASNTAGRNYVTTNPSEFSLVTETSSNALVTTATQNGKDYVVNNLTEYNLVTLADKTTAVSSATTTATAAGIVTGKDYVVANLAEYNLVTTATRDTEVADALTDGENTVIANYGQYGFIKTEDANTDLATALQDGKDYVVNHLSEYSLTTIVAKDLAVTNATTTATQAGKDYVVANLTEFDLVTKATAGTDVSNSYTNGYNQGKEYVKANPSKFELITTTDSDASVSTATTTATQAGKDYVIANLNEFNLTLTSQATSDADTARTNGINHVLNNLTTYNLTEAVENVVIDAEYLNNLNGGWNLIGTKEAITDMSIFDGLNLIWVYTNGEEEPWSAYSSNQQTIADLESSNVRIVTEIPANCGIWVNK